jgi:hypothetical protein
MEPMAKVYKNLVMEGLSGGLGNLVTRHMRDGSTRVCTRPDFSRRVFSQDQKDHQSRFRQAAAYACKAAKTQPIYAELAQGTTKTAYNWALSDWFNPPIIHRIERKDGKIRVLASDNVMVVKVQVKILDTDGKTLEEGAAVQVDSRWWEYASSADGTVEAAAWDLARNEVTAVL